MDSPASSRRALRRPSRRWIAACGLLLVALAARSEPAPDPALPGADALATELRQWMGSAAQPQPEAGILRVEVLPGALDPRLRLAPCGRVEPHLPPGTRLWGRTRVGLRCVQGKVPWNVYLPVTVKVWGLALVASRPLAAGDTLTPADLRLQEVDLAADPSPALARLEAAVGQRLNAPLPPGETLRSARLHRRTWFAAGDTVQVTARGEGFAVSQQGQALTPGFEGQATRIRTDNGRVIVAMPDGKGSASVLLAPR